MLTTARGTRGRAGGLRLLVAIIKKLLPNRHKRLDADMLSAAARRDLMLPDPPPDPRGPWY
jgi:hypothetical protein